MKQVFVIVLALFIIGCSNTSKVALSEDSFLLTSNDPEYGYTESKPIELGGFLDRYQLTYEGQKKPVIIYVNLYKFNKPLAPMGFALL